MLYILCWNKLTLSRTYYTTIHLTSLVFINVNIEDEIVIGKHSFIVVNDKPDFIEGLSYDLVTNVMSSFKNEEPKIEN